MLFNQCRSQLRQTLLSMFRHEQLIWIRASVRRNRDRFPSPNQFCSAGAESPPTAKRMLRWIALVSAVPTFHGLDGNAVSDFDFAELDGQPQWRLRAPQDFGVAGDMH